MSKVYFTPVSKILKWSDSAKLMMRKFCEEESIELENELPIKIHPGAIGNTAFIKPENYDGLIEYVQERGARPYFIETCMESETSSGKRKEFCEHGFSGLEVVIADGEDGADYELVPVKNGKHLKYAKIGKKLWDAKQVVVISHFKGHCMAGFGGAIKNLGIGFASSKGKTLVHSTKPELDDNTAIEWEKSHLPGLSDKWVMNWNNEFVSSGNIFNERVAEHAWAAVQNKHNIYINFAKDIVNNCDCDGKVMTPVYKDLGILISSDPVALDKATFDLLKEQIGETPFEGEEIFAYAEKLGLGETKYELIQLD